VTGSVAADRLNLISNAIKFTERGEASQQKYLIVTNGILGGGRYRLESHPIFYPTFSIVLDKPTDRLQESMGDWDWPGDCLP
jgi:hypothetical protein